MVRVIGENATNATSGAERGCPPSFPRGFPRGKDRDSARALSSTEAGPAPLVVRCAGVQAADVQADGAQFLPVCSARIGFVFQQFFLAERQTVLENVADGLLYAGIRPGRRQRAAADALDRVGLGDRLASTPDRLSGGERQRVAIARALIGRPAIVLADEPTGNLDSHTGAGIVALLRDLNDDGRTIIVITHNRELAASLPRQVAMLDGRVAADSANAGDRP